MFRHTDFGLITLFEVTELIDWSTSLLEPLEGVFAPHISSLNLTDMTSQNPGNFDTRRILIFMTQNRILGIVYVSLNEAVDLLLERVLSVVARAPLPGILSQ